MDGEKIPKVVENYFDFVSLSEESVYFHRFFEFLKDLLSVFKSFSYRQLVFQKQNTILARILTSLIIKLDEYGLDSKEIVQIFPITEYQVIKRLKEFK